MSSVSSKLKQLNNNQLKELIQSLSSKDIEAMDIMLARENFHHFAQRISRVYDEQVNMNFPTYEMITKVFQAFMENRLFVKQNGIHRRVDMAFFNACPGFGKSYVITRLLSIWWLAKHHTLQHIITANEKNRTAIMNDVRFLLEKPFFKKVFNDFRLIKNNDGQKITNRQGTLNMVPSRSDITGLRGDLFIFDDFFKPTNLNRAEHQTSKEFLDRFMTRGFKSKTRITKRIVVEQRIDFEDATGYLMSSYEDGNIPYIHLKIPYLFDKDTYYKFFIQNEYTKEIEKVEYFFPKDSFSSTMFSMEEYNKMLFTEYRGSLARRETECQQNPTVNEDILINPNDFQYYSVDWKDLDLKKIFATSDYASDTGRGHDYSVVCIWGLSNDNHLYLIDMFRGKYEFPDLCKLMRNVFDKYLVNDLSNGSRIKLSKLYIEKASAGSALLQVLKFALREGDISIHVHPITRVTDKYERLSAVLLDIQQKVIVLPTKKKITEDLTKEMIAFRKDNSHKHDDIVDCVIDAIYEEILPLKRNSDFTARVNKMYEFSRGYNARRS